MDVDQATTSFHTLRTLRVYRFEENSVIEGHAEEDEVYLVLLSGSVDLIVRVSDDAEAALSAELAAPSNLEIVESAVYLPPGSSYRLFATSEASVAYGRAASTSSRKPRTFETRLITKTSETDIVLESGDYAESLRFRVALISVRGARTSFSPFEAAESSMEKLLHVTGATIAGGPLACVTTPTESLQLSSGDTVASTPGESPTLAFAEGSVGLTLMLMA